MARTKAGGSILAGRAVTTGSVYVCSRCSHTWVARKKDGLPKNCPKCRSTVWMRDYHICKCARCGHQWGTVDEDPKRCPKCGTNRWNKSPTMYTCQKCSYNWASKRDWKPKRCPRCRSTKWDAPSRDEVSRTKPRRVPKSGLDVHTKAELVQRYKSGASCTQVAISTGVSFSDVYAAVRENSPNEHVRV